MRPDDKEFIFGLRPVTEAVRGGREIDRLLVRKGLHGPLYQELMQMAKEYGVPWQVVPRERLDAITRKNHQGVVAWLAAIEFQDITVVLPLLFEAGRHPVIMMLDGVTDVRNFGAIARSASCLGADAIVIGEKNSARVNGDAVKASAGALNTFPVCRVRSLARTLTYLKESGVMVIAATEKGTVPPDATDLHQPLVVIMGSEEKGISHELLKLADREISIPMTGPLGSLNVSVSAGIILYEISRQRKEG